MGQVGNGLYAALESHGLDFVEEQREYHRHGKREHEPVQTDHYRIAQNLIKGIAGKKPLKMLQPRPVASKDALRIGKILERQHHARHGHITE